MDSVGFVVNIRADKRFVDLSFHAVTADIEMQKYFVEHVFNGLLQKPVIFDVFFGIILLND